MSSSKRSNLVKQSSCGTGVSNGAFCIEVLDATMEEERCVDGRHKQLHRKQCAKARKFASRSVRQHSIQATKVPSNSTMDYGPSLRRTFSISSESNTSQTELQGHHQSYYAKESWHGGCCIWIQQILTNAIEEMLADKDFATVRQAKAAMDEMADEFVWNQLPAECLYAGVLYASLKGRVAMLECFLQKDGHMAADFYQRTALHYAASSPGADAADCIRLLLKYGADVNVWDLDGQATPLICAAASGRIELVDVLLKANADVNAGTANPNGSSALIWAVRARSFVCATRLIEAGAAVNSSRAYSETPIHVAAVQGDVECLKLLLEKQADVRVLLGAERRNPLHLAASEGNAGCIRLLLGTSKVEINSVDAKGRTPLHLAALAQSVESVSELLRNGARHDICDENKKSPLHSAVVKGSRSTDVVRLLIQSGANVNARDELEQTPLHLAAINENSKLATILIQAGADLSAKNQGSHTALSFVVRRVPDALSAIPRRLDSAVVKADHDPVDPDCELHLDFRVLVPGGDQQQVGEMRLLMALVASDQRHVLQHPVIRAFLYLKWYRIRSLFFVSLFFHFFFVSFLTVAILSTYVYRDLNNSTETQSPKSREWDPHVVNLIRYVTIFLGSMTAIKEMFQMYCNPREHFADLENVAQLFLVCGMVAVCVPQNSGSEEVFHVWQHHLAAFLVVVAWWVLMLHVGRLSIFGLYVQMFTTVAKNIAKLLGAYLSLIIGFSMGFAVLFPNKESFADMPAALITTLVMMTGELGYGDIFYGNEPNSENPKVKYIVSTHIIFLCFLLFIVIVLMNLLVGLAVSDIQGLQKSAGLDRLVRQTRLIARMERFIFFPWPINFTCWSKIPLRPLLQRRLLVVSPVHRRNYTFRPNDPRDHRFPSDIKEHLLKIVLQGKANRKGQHQHIYRTATSTSEVQNSELFDEMIRRVDDLFHNYMSQIIVMNSSVEEQLSRIERRNTVSVMSSTCDC